MCRLIQELKSPGRNFQATARPGLVGVVADASEESWHEADEENENHNEDERAEHYNEHGYIAQDESEQSTGWDYLEKMKALQAS